MADDATTPADAAAPEAAPQNERAARIGAAVAAWLDANIRNSPVSRSTEAWNHLTAAMPALVAALKEI